MEVARGYLQVAGIVIAWLGTVTLAIVDIFFIREIFWMLLARFRPGYLAAVFWGDVVVMVGAVAVMIYVILSGEHHIRQKDPARSWRNLGKAYLVLLLIPIVAYFM